MVNFYIDLCHECRVKNHHEHDKFWIWCPYSIIVTPLRPEKIGYKEGDLLVREWEIFNNSSQELTDIELTSISGDTCSKLYSARKYAYSFPDFIIKPKSYGKLILKDKIFQSIPGIYKCEMKMSTSSRFSDFGPIFKYELVILNNY